MTNITLCIINNSHISKHDMSGGEKIAMELARRWAKNINISVYTSNFGKYIWKKYKVAGVKQVQFMNLKKQTNVLSYLHRAVIGTLKVMRIKLIKRGKKHIVYSASDFWPDSLPAFFMKLKNPNITWIAGFYLFAPKPWQKKSPYTGKKWIIGLFYWLTQLPIYYIARKYADLVFVTSVPDIEKFITDERPATKIIVIRGGVNTIESEKYLNSGNTIPFQQKKYDACFVGRFHYQKGVQSLIEIWNIVSKKKKNAKLAMIGIGPLEKNIHAKIKKLKLENNIDLLGFKDGNEKYEIFKQSKIMVHPATYDSGGMAAAGGMAWGLPGVSFDLEALKTYYPKGMIKTPLNNIQQFADNVIRLLEDVDLYNSMSRDARNLILDEWDWKKRADIIYDHVFRPYMEL